MYAGWYLVLGCRWGSWGPHFVIVISKIVKYLILYQLLLEYNRIRFCFKLSRTTFLGFRWKHNVARSNKNYFDLCKTKEWSSWCLESLLYEPNPTNEAFFFRKPNFLRYVSYLNGHNESWRLTWVLRPQTVIRTSGYITTLYQYKIQSTVYNFIILITNDCLEIINIANLYLRSSNFVPFLNDILQNVCLKKS